jgi:hypothetical protein
MSGTDTERLNCPWTLADEAVPVAELAGAIGVVVIAVPPGPGLAGIPPLA